MKNIIFVLSILTLFGCGETIKKTKEKSQESAKESSILVVNYELSEMTLEDHAKLGSDVVGNFAPGKIDGLIGKTFIGNVDKGVFGGVYYFTSPSSLDAYLESELWKGIVAHPNLVNFKTDTYGIAPISDVSNGIASMRKMTNNQDEVTGNSILVVNYELSEMTLEDHAKLGSDVVGNFAPGKIDGLIGKTFIGNVDKGVFGGVYYFTSPSSLDAYLESELWKGIVAHPNLVNFKTDTYGIAPLSVISNGVPIL